LLILIYLYFDQSTNQPTYIHIYIGQKVAVKIQFPGAEKLMRNDLKNLRKLAEFLQKTDLKIDLLSAIIELQRQIGNEFDFLREARNMEAIHQGLKLRVPEVTVPQPIIATKRLLVMTFVEGNNLSKLAEFKDKAFHGNKMPRWIKEKFANNLLRTLAKAWGEQIFTLNMFNADPHPGNICISSKGRVGLLDFGQVKSLPLDLLLKFARMISAIHQDNKVDVVKAFQDLGIEMVNPNDTDMVHKIAVTMLDTRIVPGFSLDPFSNMEALKSNSVTRMPPDLYFLVRTVQMMRGIAYAFDLNFSLADHWVPLAQRVIDQDRVNKVQSTPLW